MNELQMIYSKMSDIMSEIGAIGKNQVNSFQKYRFRGIDDVMNALHPILSKHQVFMVPEVLDSKTEILSTKGGEQQLHAIIKMQYTFYAPDGSSVKAITIGEGMDKSDKSCNKAMAVAMKYCLFQTLCIPTEEMAKDDPDNYNLDINATQSQQNARQLQPSDNPPAIPMAPQNAACEECGSVINDTTIKMLGGVEKHMTASEIVVQSKQTYGRCLCVECAKKLKAARKS